MAEEGFGWAQGMMDFYERENKKAPMGMFGETLRSIAEAITTIPISMIESSLTNKAPALEGVGSYEDMQKWMGNPENAKVYEEWVSGIIPETGAMLKSVGLKQFAKSAAAAGSKLAGPEREMFLAKAQSIYKMLDKQVTQAEFDWIESIKHKPLPEGRRGQFHHTEKLIDLDVNQALDPFSARKTAAHEFIHAGQYAGTNPIADELVNYKYDIDDNLIGALKAGEERGLNREQRLSSFDFLRRSAYFRHDPTEAMARSASDEIATHGLPLRVVFDEYLEAFGKKHKAFAEATPKNAATELLGPEFEKLFQEEYIDRLIKKYRIKGE